MPKMYKYFTFRSSLQVNNCEKNTAYLFTNKILMCFDKWIFLNMFYYHLGRVGLGQRRTLRKC